MSTRWLRFVGATLGFQTKGLVALRHFVCSALCIGRRRACAGHVSIYFRWLRLAASNVIFLLPDRPLSVTKLVMRTLQISGGIALRSRAIRLFDEHFGAGHFPNGLRAPAGAGARQRHGDNG